MTTDLRQRIVRAAEGELGPGDPPKYWRSCKVAGPPFPKHWCGGFALWAIHQAEVALDVAWKIGLGFCEVQRLPRTTKPKPGDVAYKDKPFQHHAVVERADGDTVTTIDGNQPHCARRQKKLSAWTCFYSIEPLLTKAAAEHPTEPAPPPSSQPPPHVVPWVSLRRHDYGARVREWQARLVAAGHALPKSTRKDGTLDGDFGDETEAATRAVQCAALLPQTGIVDRKTWEHATP
jgi:hypothetical protein